MQLQKLSKIMLLVVLAAFTTNIEAQERHAFSAKQSVDYAVKNSVQVKNALLDVKIQEQTNREITAAAYPQLNGSIGSTYYPNVAVQSFPNFIAQGTYGVLDAEGVKDGSGNPIKSPSDFGFIQAQFGTKWVANAGVTLSQILFDGQVFVGLQARETAMAFSDKSREVTEENIKANVYKVYYSLIASKTQVTLLDANLDRLNKLQHDTKIMFDNGFAEKLDINKIEVQISNVETQKLKTLNSVNNGFLGLKLLMGMPIKDSLILTDTLTYNQIREGLLESENFRYEDRKEFQFLELNRKLNEFNIKRYKMTYMPTANLNAGYNKNAQRNQWDFLTGDYFTSSYVGLSINIPIFDGFAKDARIKKSKFELQKTVNQMDNLKISIDNDIAQARANFAAAIATLDNQRKNMTLAENVYDQTKKKFEIGTGSNTEITSAQTDLQQAQTNFVQALYDAIVAKVDYFKATGKLQ